MVNSRVNRLALTIPPFRFGQQIQNLAMRMMPFFRDEAACVRAACPVRGESILLDDHRVLAP